MSSLGSIKKKCFSLFPRVTPSNTDDNEFPTLSCVNVIGRFPICNIFFRSNLPFVRKFFFMKGNDYYWITINKFESSHLDDHIYHVGFCAARLLRSTSISVLHIFFCSLIYHRLCNNAYVYTQRYFLYINSDRIYRQTTLLATHTTGFTLYHWSSLAHSSCWI